MFIQAPFPLHLAPKFADCCLRMDLYQQSEASFYNRLLGASTADTHSLAHQLIVDFDIRPHRTSPLCVAIVAVDISTWV
jgi:hypothetical protein